MNINHEMKYISKFHLIISKAIDHKYKHVVIFFNIPFIILVVKKDNVQTFIKIIFEIRSRLSGHFESDYCVNDIHTLNRKDIRSSDIHT